MLTLSGAHGDYIDYLTMHYPKLVLLIRQVLLPITWICRIFKNLDCRLLEFYPPVSCLFCAYYRKSLL